MQSIINSLEECGGSNDYSEDGSDSDVQPPRDTHENKKVQLQYYYFNYIPLTDYEAPMNWIFLLII